MKYSAKSKSRRGTTQEKFQVQTKQSLWESQYDEGETKGPIWYQMISKWAVHREKVAFDLLTEGQNLKRKVFVDIGCGEGDLVRKMSPLVKKAIGTDIARNRIALAKKMSKGYKNVTFQVVDNDKQMPFSPNSIDSIACIGVVEYTLDPYFVIADIHRVMKPGGVFILQLPNIAYLPERLKLLFGILPSWPDAVGWQGGRLHTFTFATATQLLEDQGFTITHQTASGFLRPLRTWWASLLCGDIILRAVKK